VLFADVRGSTALAEDLGSTQFAALLNRFYAAVSDVLIPSMAIIDKMIGDEVMAFWVPAIGSDYRKRAVQAAEGILKSMSTGPDGDLLLPVGIGVHAGVAYVGKVGSEGVQDFTVLGDVVNTASRMQALAAAGQIVLSEETYAEVADAYPNAPSEAMEVRGKAEPMKLYTITI